MGDFNDDLVLYIDSKSGGFSNTANFTDAGDDLRKALSGFDGSNRSVVNFPPGFEADFAIGADPNNSNFAGVWELQANASHTYLTSANISSITTTSAVYTMTVDTSTIDAPTGTSSFKFIATYLNSGNQFRSDETIGDGLSSFSQGANTATFTTYYQYNGGQKGGLAITTAAGSWSNSNTWVNGNVPLSGDSVVISHNINLDQNEELMDLSVTAGNTFTIDPSYTLTVNDQLVNNGTVTVADGGSLLQTSSTDNNGGTTGIYNIVRTILAQDHLRFNYWASPVDNAQIGEEFSSSNFSDRLYFDASTATSGPPPNPGWQTATGKMNPGQGYAVTPSTQSPATNTDFNDTRTFVADLGSSEKLNNGDVTYSISNVDANDYILLGNPYSSALDFDAFRSDHSANITGTVYYWDASPDDISNSDYASWNNMGTNDVPTSNKAAPDQNIQSMQGFMVQAESTIGTGNTLNFTYQNDMRVSGQNASGGFFKNETRERLWLTLTSQYDTNSTLVGLANDATVGFDQQYDGEILKANSNHSFYSMEGANEYTIQGLPKFSPNTTYKRTIPLGIDAWKTGQYTIALDSLNNWQSANYIYLLDSAQGNVIDLKQNDYTFAVNQMGVIHNRFYLAIGETGQNNVSIDESGKSGELHYYQKEDNLVLNDALSQMALKSARVISLGGVPVLEADLNSNDTEHQLNVGHLANGVYMLQVEAQDGALHTYKVYLR